MLQIELPGLGWVHSHIPKGEHDADQEPASDGHVAPDSAAKSNIVTQPDLGNEANSTAESDATQQPESEDELDSGAESDATQKPNLDDEHDSGAESDATQQPDAAAKPNLLAKGKQKAVSVRQRVQEQPLQEQPLLCFRHRWKASPLKWQSVHVLNTCERCKVTTWSSRSQLPTDWTVCMLEQSQTKSLLTGLAFWLTIWKAHVALALLVDSVRGGVMIFSMRLCCCADVFMLKR